MKNVRSLSPKLPLVYNPSQGYQMNTGFVELVLQNLKMILLTSPGERIMDPEFGVGLKNYLFEQNVQQVHGDISARIKRQVKKYLPSVEINAVDFFTPENTPGIPENYLNIRVSFHVKPLDLDTRMELFFDSKRGLFTDGFNAGRII